MFYTIYSRTLFCKFLILFETQNNVGRVKGPFKTILVDIALSICHSLTLQRRSEKSSSRKLSTKPLNFDSLYRLSDIQNVQKRVLN